MPWTEQPQDVGDGRPGCMDAFVLTRMALGILFWPVVATIAVGGAIVFGIVLAASYPMQTLAGVVILAVAATLVWRWIKARRRRPED